VSLIPRYDPKPVARKQNRNMKRNPPLKFLIPCVLLLVATTVQASDDCEPAEKKPDAARGKEGAVVTVPSAPNQASTPISPDIIQRRTCAKIR